MLIIKNVRPECDYKSNENSAKVLWQQNSPLYRRSTHPTAKLWFNQVNLYIQTWWASRIILGELSLGPSPGCDEWCLSGWMPIGFCSYTELRCLCQTDGHWPQMSTRSLPSSYLQRWQNHCKSPAFASDKFSFCSGKAIKSHFVLAFSFI